MENTNGDKIYFRCIAVPMFGRLKVQQKKSKLVDGAKNEAKQCRISNRHLFVDKSLGRITFERACGQQANMDKQTNHCHE